MTPKKNKYIKNFKRTNRISHLFLNFKMVFNLTIGFHKDRFASFKKNNLQRDWPNSLQIICYRFTFQVEIFVFKHSTIWARRKHSNELYHKRLSSKHAPRSWRYQPVTTYKLIRISNYGFSPMVQPWKPIQWWKSKQQKYARK